MTLSDYLENMEKNNMKSVITEKYVRPSKYADLLAQYEKIQRIDELTIETVNNGYILPLKKNFGDNLLFGRGGVVSEEKEYVQLSSIPQRVDGKYDFTKFVQRKDETVVYCGYLVNHWGHFLIEAVNRLWFYLENKTTAYRYVFFVESGNSRLPEGNYKEFFELLGVWEKIEIINQPTQFKKIIVPESAFRGQVIWSIRYRSIFDEVTYSALSKAPETTGQLYNKIYISRSSFSKARRSEVGLDMMDNFFKKNGYEIVYPEQITLSQLILYLNRSEKCVTESGTTAHNLLFGYTGMKMAIIERCSIINPMQQALDIVRRADITYIDANYEIYPVNLGGGPYFLAYNRYLKQYTEDLKLQAPDVKYLNDRYTKKQIRKWMKLYKRNYYLMWGIEGWEIKYSRTLYEAYADSLEVLRPYLQGTVLFKFSQVFEIETIARAVKGFIKRV